MNRRSMSRIVMSVETWGMGPYREAGDAWSRALVGWMGMEAGEGLRPLGVAADRERIKGWICRR